MYTLLINKTYFSATETSKTNVVDRGFQSEITGLTKKHNDQAIVLPFLGKPHMMPADADQKSQNSTKDSVSETESLTYILQDSQLPEILREK